MPERAREPIPRTPLTGGVKIVPSFYLIRYTQRSFKEKLSASVARRLASVRPCARRPHRMRGPALDSFSGRSSFRPFSISLT